MSNVVTPEPKKLVEFIREFFGRRNIISCDRTLPLSEFETSADNDEFSIILDKYWTIVRFCTPKGTYLIEGSTYCPITFEDLQDKLGLVHIKDVHYGVYSPYPSEIFRYWKITKIPSYLDEESE